MNRIRPLALLATAAALLFSLAACTPHEGDSCDPSKASDYYSQHTENGKTKTVHLHCINDRWRKI